jgi:hypothetical protein
MRTPWIVVFAALLTACGPRDDGPTSPASFSASPLDRFSIPANPNAFRPTLRVIAGKKWTFFTDAMAAEIVRRELLRGQTPSVPVEESVVPRW